MTFYKTGAVKVNLGDNPFHNIVRAFDGLPIFPLTTSETVREYYL